MTLGSVKFQFTVTHISVLSPSQLLAEIRTTQEKTDAKMDTNRKRMEARLSRVRVA
jgi:hypothetical protein